MRAQKHHLTAVIFGGLLGLLLTSCATTVGSNVTVSEANLSKYETLSAADAIAALEERVNEAKSANMPFLAPNYFREASGILGDAQEASAKKSRDDLIGDIAKADALLDKGQSMMAVVQDSFAYELELKKWLDKNSAANIYPREYEKSIGELSSLIEKVEHEKADEIEDDKIKLRNTMQALDIKTVQYITLHESEIINEDTENKDGEKQAPATFAEALRAYQDAMNRIAQAPHDDALVKRAGNDALFAAQHARHVSERVMDLQNKFKESAESIVLEEEKRLLDISTALGHRDLRDQPIEKQAEEIARIAGERVQQQQKAKPADGAAYEQRTPVAAPEIIQDNQGSAEQAPVRDELIEPRAD